MELIEKFFYEHKEKNNFIKFFRYCCDFSNKNWFEYDPIDSPKLYLFHSEGLELLGKSYYIKKLVFNHMLFRTIILLHFSNFYLTEKDFVSDPFFVRVTKFRLKIKWWLCKIYLIKFLVIYFV